ncbi:hypothetical protein XM38_051320 [Halomicronema hongdechloris C2206]|uniref:Uncharacterized protein n=1 Tax=Halomicronema hongdechloris C2206 TaxID=1641165 RepID=A0A1Z3HVJ1_9CYAN|nr:hypothetical protein [Halomicronema hongdechloris]ASC74157.1 hypothetical protein XM38_051320 [Halomicronema hongdechloris C2206]
MNNQSSTYEQLELLPVGSFSTHPPSKVAQGLKTVMGRLLRFFAPDNTPKVHTVRARKGEIWFDAYDPVTQQRLKNRSEEALRIWLEQRYNAHSRQDPH